MASARDGTTSDCSELTTARRVPSRQPAPAKFNKIPAEFKLSGEGEQLLRTLRKDLGEMKEAIALSIGDQTKVEIQRMRLEMRELVAHIQKVHETSPPVKQDCPSFGYEARAEVECAKSAAMLLRDAADAQEQEIQRLSETVDCLAALLERVGRAEAERLQGGGGTGDDQLAADITTALTELTGGSLTGSGQPVLRPTVCSQISGQIGEPRGQTITSNNSGMLIGYSSSVREDQPNPAGKRNRDYLDPELERQEAIHPFKWEWERSNNKGWEPYTRSQSHRIEKAWRSGASRVRLRSGADGKSPMELHLVNMLQLDPISKNARSVRRVGDVPWWMNAKRHLWAIRLQIKTGEPRWESYESYTRRQVAVMGPSVDTVKPKLMKTKTQLIPTSQWRSLAARLWRKEWMRVLTLTLVLLQAIWVYFDVDVNIGKTLYEKQPLHQLFDYFFCVFFLIDLFLHLSIFKPLSICWCHAWFVFDMVCVIGSVVEVFVVPPFNALTEGAIRDWDGFGALRVMRLAKVIRVWRVFSAHSDFGPFFKGLWSGMKSAAFIWIIIVTMLYFFGILLRLYAQDDIRTAFFPSVFDSVLTLMVKGIMLDEVGGMVDEMTAHGDLLSLSLFLVFLWITYFNLLNMLVGSFCSVAGDVSAAEKNAAEIEYLKCHLESIVECYIEDEGFIGKSEFDLIMGNADVHRTLEQSGTDMEEIKVLKKLLFHNEEKVDFDSLFQAIVHFRKGKTATVKDILSIQEVVSSQLRHLERLLVNGPPGNNL